jgi:hypothetical protein
MTVRSMTIGGPISIAYLLSAFACCAQNPSAIRTKWEYKIANEWEISEIAANNLLAGLNALGGECFRSTGTDGVTGDTRRSKPRTRCPLKASTLAQDWPQSDGNRALHRVVFVGESRKLH